MDQSNSPQNPMQPQVPNQGMPGLGQVGTNPVQNTASQGTVDTPIPQSPVNQPSSPQDFLQQPAATTPTPVQDFSQAVPTPPQTTPPDGATTITPPTDMGGQTIPEQKKGGLGKKIIFLILGVLSILGIAAAVYFFVVKKQPAEPITVDTTTPTPTPVPEEDLLEKEVGETPEEQEVIDLEEVSVDEEFKSVEQDLQKL